MDCACAISKSLLRICLIVLLRVHRQHKMCVLKICVLYFFMAFTTCKAYKILVVYPYPTRGHANLGDGVVRILLKEGHEVTHITPFPYKPASPRLRVVDVSYNQNLLPDIMYNFTAVINNEYRIENHGQIMRFVIEIMKHTLENDNVQKLLNDPHEQFDTVIVEWLLSEVLAGLSVVFNCPFIWVSGMETNWLLLRLIDQPSNPAFTADVMSSSIPPFIFWERITELYTQLKVLYLKFMYLDVLESKEYEKLFSQPVEKRGRQLPPYHEVQYNVSLILGNSHASMGKALSVPQNYIRVGGYHINEEVQPLSGDLKNIIVNAKNGVIYFSMGSNLKSKDIPKEIQLNIMNMFSELKQTVVWKFEENLPNTAQNVHVIKWAPQHSILAHPNIKLFITHGGLLSTTEALHFGVPIIGIPIFGDQFMNIAKFVRKGFAKKVDFTKNIAEELKNAIEDIIDNPVYSKRAKELSFIYHDRPVSPAKELAHWVRHVIETGGAPHLRSPALHVPLYQKLYLDLLIVVLVILFVIIKLMTLIFYSIKKMLISYSKVHKIKAKKRM